MYWNITDEERLFMAFELADNPKLLKLFLKDFLTKKEIESFVIRLKAMCMIKEVATYENIRMITGLSPQTISRLTKIMKDRDCGVQQVIKKFEKKGRPYSA